MTETREELHAEFEAAWADFQARGYAPPPEFKTFAKLCYFRGRADEMLWSVRAMKNEPEESGRPAVVAPQEIHNPQGGVNQ